MAVGMAISFAGKIKAGKDAQKAHYKNARELELSAATEFKAGAVDAWRVGMKSDAAVASGKVSEAGSGFRADSASAERAAELTTLAGEYQKDLITSNAARSARGMIIRAGQEIDAGRQAVVNALLGATGDAIQGGASLAAYSGKQDALTRPQSSGGIYPT